MPLCEEAGKEAEEKETVYFFEKQGKIMRLMGGGGVEGVGGDSLVQ